MTRGSLGTKLRLLRAERKLTLEEAAKRTGVTRESLGYIERGQQSPRAGTLAKIAEGYGVPVAQLLEEPTLAGKAFASEARLPEDPNDWLLMLLDDAASTYALDSGIELNWDPATYDHVIRRLGETAMQAGASDLRAGNQARAMEILRRWAFASTSLEARKARLEEGATRAPERPAAKLIRRDLADPEALERQLADVFAA